MQRLAQEEAEREFLFKFGITGEHRKETLIRGQDGREADEDMRKTYRS